MGTTTIEREELLCKRTAAMDDVLDLDGLAQLMCAHDTGSAVCRHLDERMPTGYRSATLATIGLDPARRQAHVAEDGPCRRSEQAILTAG